MATCIHLQSRLVDRCSAIVNACRREGRNYGDLMHCAHCDRTGYLNDVSFYEHFVAKQHFVCVRMGTPTELYCCACGDFEYSDSFDKKVERKRRRCAPLSAFAAICPQRVIAAPTSSSLAAAPTIAQQQQFSVVLTDPVEPNVVSSHRMVMRYAHAAAAAAAAAASGDKPYVSYSSRGICNMGSTCFISSVLQCILHNPLLKDSPEMKLSFTEPYDKGCCKATMSNKEKTINGAGSSISPVLTGLDGTAPHVTPPSPPGSGASAPQSVLTDGCIACELRCLFAEVADDPAHHSASLIPSNLLFAVWIFAEYMAGYDQQDAHEFLIALLDGLGQHLDKFHCGSKTESNTAHSLTGPGPSPGKHIAASGGNVVGNAFLGVLHSRLSCMVCGNLSNTSDPLLDVSLSLEYHREEGEGSAVLLEAGADGEAGAIKRDPFAPVPLYDCLRYFTSKETLSQLVMCGRCQAPCPAQKSLSFAVAPRTLVLHLKRFDAIHQRKIHTKVLFDLHNFDLSEFMMPDSGGSKKQKQQQKPQVLYDLQGVVTHKGSLNTGHYIAYVSTFTAPDSDGVQLQQWVRCDDENVTVVPPSEVSAAEAYILFYVRK